MEGPPTGLSTLDEDLLAGTLLRLVAFLGVMAGIATAKATAGLVAGMSVLLRGLGAGVVWVGIGPTGARGRRTGG